MQTTVKTVVVIARTRIASNGCIHNAPAAKNTADAVR